MESLIDLFGRNSMILIVILIICENPKYCSDAKIIQGTLWTHENWRFLARFCFRNDHGSFEYDVRYDESYAVQNIDLYYDTPEQWTRAYGRKADLTNCMQKESVLQVENNQFINLTQNMIVSGCVRENESEADGTRYIRCQGVRNFNTARDRWWYVAVSNCQSVKGLKMDYKFLMTNGKPYDYFHYHFSADEFYILPILIVASALHLFLLFTTTWFAIALKTRQLFHVTYKLFLITVLFHCIGCLIMCTHYCVYGIDGIGLPGNKLLGRILESAADITLVLLLILLAKGYTITRARLRQASSIKVTMFMCVYGVTYCCLFIYEQVYFDPGQVLYIYQSTAGYGLVILRFVAWIMFIYSTFFTLKHYPDKGAFYYPFFCFYTLWFCAGPCIILISNYIIAEWVREKVVVSVEHFVAAVGHICLLVLTRPSAHNKNFPYHVRTTQIGIMEAMSGNTNLGNNRLDGFSHGGNYGVTNPSSALDVFTVDSVGRVPTPQTIQPRTVANGSQPPPYSSAPPPPSYINPPPPPPPWSIVQNPNGNASNPSANGSALNGKPKIYDPNEDADSSSD